MGANNEELANILKDFYSVGNTIVYSHPVVGTTAKVVGLTNSAMVNVTVDVAVNDQSVAKSTLSFSVGSAASIICSPAGIMASISCGVLGAKAAESLYDSYFGSEYTDDGLSRLYLKKSLLPGQAGMYRDSNGNINVCYVGDDEVFVEKSLQEVVNDAGTRFKIESAVVTDPDSNTQVKIDKENKLVEVKTPSPLTPEQTASALMAIAPAARPVAAVNYEIQPGDSLSSIAAANNTTIDSLLALNPGISDPNVINAGDNLLLKPAEAAKVENISLNDDEYIPYQGDLSELNSAKVLGEGVELDMMVSKEPDSILILSYFVNLRAANYV